ncbi:MAG: hypothetical protein H7Y86_13225 [Rhizobacter sp.]|nr:hypothetical protein [Ferruginibacter sp.]
MKKFLLVPMLLTAYSISFAQKDAGFYLRGYQESGYQKYFDSQHQSGKGTIEELSSSCYFYVVFKIDSSANIFDFELIEIPEIPIPETAKKYIKNLFFSTRGKWEQKEVSGKNAISEELLFSVSLLYKNEKIEDRINYADIAFQFALTELALQPRLKVYDLMREKKIYLSF